MYALFAGKVYYPGGGMNDFKGLFRSKEEAITFYKAGESYGDITFHWEWAHVVEIETMKVVVRMIFDEER